MRDQIVDFLRRELIGPDPVALYVQENGEEILLNDPPRIRYGAGVLFPQSAVVAISQDANDSEMPVGAQEELEADPSEELPEIEVTGEDSTAGDGSDAVAAEDPVSLTNAYLPSALGFSCLVELLSEELLLEVNAARYRGVQRKYVVNGEEKAGIQYEREPISETLSIPTVRLRGNGIRTYREAVQTSIPDGGLEVRILSRPRGSTSAGRESRLLTVTLINTNRSGNGRTDNENCYFQVSMRLRSANGEACFLEYPEREGEALDLEDKSMMLLYRHRKTFAVGHGCAADWEEVDGRATLVRSEVLPAYEVKPVVPTRFKDLTLSMLELSDLRDEANVVGLLSDLCDKYEDWINKRETEASSLEEKYREAASNHLGNCRRCLERMRSGIEILASDPTARLAFRLANRAMLMQQLHYAMPLREWRGGVAGKLQIDPVVFPDLENPPTGKGTWYPFQLAFILINIRSQVLPQDAERRIVDLIWFPTGGGKTEAYLGLTAFTIFLRRLLNPSNGGVTVLMRYTLRLLTSQQFQRAATLICACERIRAEMQSTLGTERVSIGLWVGGGDKGLTPNKRDDAIKAFNKITKGSPENPFLVLRCPWCSAQFGPVDIARQRRVLGYEKQRSPMTIIFRCPDEDCPFSSNSLPLYVIDEDVYDNAPSLLIGTVDKFAMLPWRPEARSILGIDRVDCTPPDLIIQDELHLIAGPLGSMVGHYETVIDKLCTQQRGENELAPKIVASTATICRADEQVRALYGREVFQFPPQCLRAGDSFFALEDETAPGRIYVGVHTSALPSHVTAQVRVFAALLQGTKSASVSSEAERDPYFTLIGYFNSLRELGHAATLLRADIPEYLNAMWLRKGIRGDRRRFINNALELTSRIASTEIPESLQMLERTYPQGDGERPVDVCLATNMIAVGVDVPRLGLMAVVGQPKTTSEYIQATSRVGRSSSAPGVVITIYHTGKPRDRSHYERFRSYHASLYRQVEPTSVTPFAAPVRERALHALLITLVRFLGGPENQKRPQPYPDAKLLKMIKDVILDRVSNIDPDERKSTQSLIEELLARWERVLPPRYGDFGPPQTEVPLMYPAGTQPLDAWNGKSLSTPSSMRHVDASCEAAVIGQYPRPEEV